MAKAGYVTSTEGAVALSAATAKSILGIAAPASFGVDLKKLRIGFDGVTASAVPVLIELCYATFATNAPGTNSTSATVDQAYGRTITPGFTAAKNWTTEPTVLTPLEEWLLTPAGGTILYDYPLGDTPDTAASNGFVIRCNAPATVNVRAALWAERA
jgi:hypothetical protein